jgi:hypothetical protein
MIRVETELDDMYYEVDRLSRGPAYSDLLDFEIVLQDQFQASQRAVHVQTRSLKMSGKSSFNSTKDKWEGEITYGGPSGGIFDPVDYAEYERERGGLHDFLAPVERLSREYIAAMRKFLEG